MRKPDFVRFVESFITFKQRGKSMDRRDFLEKGAAIGVAGAAALASPSCTFLPQFLQKETWQAMLPNMARYLVLVDGGLLHIEKGGILAGFAGCGPHPEDKEALATKSLKTLYVTGMFGDLPEKGQLHPGMQERVWKAMPDINKAVFGTMGHIESLTPSEKTEMQKILKRRGSPAMQICEALDGQAASCGVSQERRRQTRKMFSYVSMRLAHQHPDILFDELLKKSRKIAALGGSVEDAEKLLAARLGHDELLRRKAQYPVIMEEWRQACGSNPTVPGENAMIVGGVVMGIGAVVLAGGGIGLAVTGSLGGIIVASTIMTIGGVILLAGLITLIVGAVIHHKAKAKNV